MSASDNFDVYYDQHHEHYLDDDPDDKHHLINDKYLNLNFTCADDNCREPHYHVLSDDEYNDLCRLHAEHGDHHRASDDRPRYHIAYDDGTSDINDLCPACEFEHTPCTDDNCSARHYTVAQDR